jgi:hypothetical protein
VSLTEEITGVYAAAEPRLADDPRYGGGPQSGSAPEHLADPEFVDGPRPAALIGEFRRTPVLVPLDAQGGLWAAELGGILWIHAFTDEAELLRFAAAREEAGRDREYRTVLGARLLDVVVPATGAPTGIALNPAGGHPMLLPPVRGIVPEHVALDALDTAGAPDTANTEDAVVVTDTPVATDTADTRATLGTDAGGAR